MIVIWLGHAVRQVGIVHGPSSEFRYVGHHNFVHYLIHLSSGLDRILPKVKGVK